MKNFKRKKNFNISSLTSNIDTEVVLDSERFFMAPNIQPSSTPQAASDPTSEPSTSITPDNETPSETVSELINSITVKYLDDNDNWSTLSTSQSKPFLIDATLYKNVNVEDVSTRFKVEVTSAATLGTYATSVSWELDPGSGGVNTNRALIKKQTTGSTWVTDKITLASTTDIIEVRPARNGTAFGKTKLTVTVTATLGTTSTTKSKTIYIESLQNIYDICEQTDSLTGFFDTILYKDDYALHLALYNLDLCGATDTPRLELVGQTNKSSSTIKVQAVIKCITLTRALGATDIISKNSILYSTNDSGNLALGTASDASYNYYTYTNKTIWDNLTVLTPISKRIMSISNLPGFTKLTLRYKLPTVWFEKIENSGYTDYTLSSSNKKIEASFSSSYTFCLILLRHYGLGYADDATIIKNGWKILSSALNIIKDNTSLFSDIQTNKIIFLLFGAAEALLWLGSSDALDYTDAFYNTGWTFTTTKTGEPGELLAVSVSAPNTLSTGEIGTLNANCTWSNGNPPDESALSIMWTKVATNTGGGSDPIKFVDSTGLEIAPPTDLTIHIKSDSACTAKLTCSVSYNNRKQIGSTTFNITAALPVHTHNFKIASCKLFADDSGTILYAVARITCENCTYDMSNNYKYYLLVDNSGLSYNSSTRKLTVTFAKNYNKAFIWKKSATANSINDCEFDAKSFSYYNLKLFLTKYGNNPQYKLINSNDTNSNIDFRISSSLTISNVGASRTLSINLYDVTNSRNTLVNGLTLLSNSWGESLWLLEARIVYPTSTQTVSIDIAADTLGWSISDGDTSGVELVPGTPSNGIYPCNVINNSPAGNTVTVTAKFASGATTGAYAYCYITSNEVPWELLLDADTLPDRCRAGTELRKYKAKVKAIANNSNVTSDLKFKWTARKVNSQHIVEIKSVYTDSSVLDVWTDTASYVYVLPTGIGQTAITAVAKHNGGTTSSITLKDPLILDGTDPRILFVEKNKVIISDFDTSSNDVNTFDLPFNRTDLGSTIKVYGQPDSFAEAYGGSWLVSFSDTSILNTIVDPLLEDCIKVQPKKAGTTLVTLTFIPTIQDSWFNHLTTTCTVTVKHSHNYDDDSDWLIEWNWPIPRSASVKFTCRTCGESETVEVEATAIELIDASRGEYRATVVFHNNTYTTTKIFGEVNIEPCTVMPAELTFLANESVNTQKLCKVGPITGASTTARWELSSEVEDYLTLSGQSAAGVDPLVIIVTKQTDYLSINDILGTLTVDITDAGTKIVSIILKGNAVRLSFAKNGHGVAPHDLIIKKGTTATKPLDPTEPGWIFGGWYENAACTGSPWNFNTSTISSNKTLFAKWTEELQVALTYTVTFDMMGHGDQISVLTIEENSLITAPVEPTESGWTFGGWYKELSCINAWVFNTDRVIANTILYAKWTETLTVVLYSVILKANGGTINGATQRVLTVTRGQSVILTTPDVRENYNFIGWFTAANGGNQTLSPYKPTGNITLYAQWLYLEPAAPETSTLYKINTGESEQEAILKTKTTTTEPLQVAWSDEANDYELVYVKLLNNTTSESVILLAADGTLANNIPLTNVPALDSSYCRECIWTVNSLSVLLKTANMPLDTSTNALDKSYRIKYRSTKHILLDIIDNIIWNDYGQCVVTVKCTYCNYGAEAITSTEVNYINNLQIASFGSKAAQVSNLIILTLKSIDSTFDTLTAEPQQYSEDTWFVKTIPGQISSYWTVARGNIVSIPKYKFTIGAKPTIFNYMIPEATNNPNIKVDSWWTDFTTANGSLRLRPGLNIIKFSKSANIMFKNIGNSDQNIILGQLDVVKVKNTVSDGTDFGLAVDMLDYRTGKLVLSDSITVELRSTLLLIDIDTADPQHNFYYNMPMNNATEIELSETSLQNSDEKEKLTDPRVFYNVNNANNKFVISEIDADYLIDGIKIAKSSKL